MSEIAKCPACGENPGWHDFDIEARIFGGERSYFCCGMKASTAALWNKYATLRAENERLKGEVERLMERNKIIERVIARERVRNEIEKMGLHPVPKREW